MTKKQLYRMFEGALYDFFTNECGWDHYEALENVLISELNIESCNDENDVMNAADDMICYLCTGS